MDQLKRVDACGLPLNRDGKKKFLDRIRTVLMKSGSCTTMLCATDVGPHHSDPVKLIANPKLTPSGNCVFDGSIPPSAVQLQ